MKKLLSVLYVAFLMLFSTSASSKDQSIVITGNPTRAQWIDRVGQNLDDAIRYPRPVFGRPLDGGLVSVVFVADRAGRTSAARVLRSSKSPELDRAALEAVARMRPAYPTPVGISSHQRIQANILFATSYQDHARQMKLLRDEASRHNARVARDAETLVLTLAPGATGGSSRRAR